MTTIIKIALGYIGGILLGQLTPTIPSPYLWAGIGVLFLAASISFLLRYDRITNSLLLTSPLLIGLFSYNLTIEPSWNIPPFSSKGPVKITGTIIRDPDIRGTNTILVIRPEEAVAQEEIPRLKGYIRITIRWPRTTYRYGERIRLSSKLWTPQRPKTNGRLSYRAYLSRKNIYWLIEVKGDKGIIKLGRGEAHPIMKFALYLKERMVKIIRETIPHPESLVLEGITLGERKALPREVKWYFNQVGAGHILTPSGLHVGFVLFIFLGFFHKVLRVPLKRSVFLTIFFIILYALIAGPRPAVIRASIMATVILISHLLDREVNIYHSLALAALIILIVNPLELFDCGFQLSFLATLGIIALAPPIYSYLKRFLWEWLALPLAVSISAQIALWPLFAYYFNQVSLIAVVANLVIVPLTALGMGFGFAVVGIGWVNIKLGRILGFLNHLILMGIVDSACLFSLTPYACLYPPQPPIYLVLTYYFVLTILRVLMECRIGQEFLFLLKFE